MSRTPNVCSRCLWWTSGSTPTRPPRHQETLCWSIGELYKPLSQEIDFFRTLVTTSSKISKKHVQVSDVTEKHILETILPHYRGSSFRSRTEVFWRRRLPVSDLDTVYPPNKTVRQTSVGSGWVWLGIWLRDDSEHKQPEWPLTLLQRLNSRWPFSPSVKEFPRNWSAWESRK